MAEPNRAVILIGMRPGTMLFLAFLLVPPIEIGLFVVVGQRIGLWWTLGIVLATAIIGARLVSRQGRGVLARLRNEIASAQFPGKTLAHGAMIIISGTLLLTPGFLTDLIGFSLLSPQVREVVRKWAARRWANRVTIL